MKNLIIIENEQGLNFSVQKVKTEEITCEGIIKCPDEIGFLIDHLEEDDISPEKDLFISLSIAKARELAKAIENICNQSFEIPFKPMKDDSFE
jgi:hypothetical protein